nr:MAG TPA: hypothetical protein [Caudoviricetes sp.]
MTCVVIVKVIGILSQYLYLIWDIIKLRFQCS